MPLAIMCGRFAIYTPGSRLAARYFGMSLPVGVEHPRYNVTPGGPILTLMSLPDRAVVLRLSHWGFRPPWARVEAPTPVNIRAEKAASAPYFRSAFAHRRCLIPANGWYEWHHTEAGKQPWYIRLKEADPDEVLFFAGLWEPAGEGGASCCAILTEPAAPALAFLHARQPVVLDPDTRWSWLDPTLTDRDAVRGAVRRLCIDRLVAYPVSTRVNRPDNDDASLIEPLAGPSGKDANPDLSSQP